MPSVLTKVLTWVGAIFPSLGPSDAKGFVGTDAVQRTLQRDTYTCGVHAVRAVLRMHRQNPSFDRLEQELGTTDEGTSPNAMIRCLRRRGFSVGERWKMSLGELRKQLDRGRLVLAFTDEVHVLLVHGMDDTYVYVADSSPRYAMLRRLPRRLFYRRWDRAGLIVYKR